MTAESTHDGRVNVTINGRQFRLACEEGQEAHLRQLAKDLDDRINGLRARFGEIGDARLVVMAALMAADELLEAGKAVQRLEDEMAALESARVNAADREQGRQAAIAAAFNTAAERIEGLVKKLNQAPPGGGAEMGKS
jgi:cell division protein ZapA